MASSAAFVYKYPTLRIDDVHLSSAKLPNDMEFMQSAEKDSSIDVKIKQCIGDFEEYRRNLLQWKKGWMYFWLVELREWERTEDLKYGIDFTAQFTNFHSKVTNSLDDDVVRIRGKLAQLQTMMVLF